MLLRHTTLLAVAAMFGACNINIHVDREVTEERLVALDGSRIDPTCPASGGYTDDQTEVILEPVDGNCEMSLTWAGMMIDGEALHEQVQQSLEENGASGDVEVQFDSVEATVNDVYLVNGSGAAIALGTIPSWELSLYIDDEPMITGDDLSGSDVTNEDGLLDEPFSAALSQGAIDIINTALAEHSAADGSADGQVVVPLAGMQVVHDTAGLSLLFNVTYHVEADVSVALSQQN